MDMQQKSHYFNLNDLNAILLEVELRGLSPEQMDCMQKLRKMLLYSKCPFCNKELRKDSKYAIFNKYIEDWGIDKGECNE